MRKRTFRAALGAILLLAFALRLIGSGGAIAVDRPIINDEGAYYSTAEGILAGTLAKEDLARSVMRVPGYPALIALSLRLFGPSLWMIEILQALAGCATILLAALLARRWLGERAALLTALLLALHPVLILFTHYLFVETLYGLAITLLVWLLVQADGRARRWPWLMAAASCIALGSLVRSQLLPLALPLLAWSLVRSWRAGARLRRVAGEAALVAVTILAVLMPWAARNQAVHGTPILLDTTGTMLLGLNSGLVPYREAEKLVMDAGGPSLIKRQQIAQQLLRRHLQTDPLGYLGVRLYEAGEVWLPEPPIPFELREKYVGMSDTALTLYADVKVLWGALIFPLALAGLLGWPGPRGAQVLLALILVANNGSIALTHAEPRYLYPLFPLLAILAPAGLMALRRRRPLPALAALLFFVLLSVPALLPFGNQLAALSALREGRRLAAVGQVQQALAQFDRAAALQITWSSPLTERGKALVATDPAAAEAAWQRALAIRPDDTEALLGLSGLAYAQGQPAPAAATVPIALEAQRAAWQRWPAPTASTDVGGADLGALCGFYPAERDEEGRTVRWSSPRAWLRTGGLPAEKQLMLSIQLRTLSIIEDRRELAVLVDGREVATLSPTPQWRTYHIPLPALERAGAAVVELRIDGLLLRQLNNDQRPLGVQVNFFEIRAIE